MMRMQSGAPGARLQHLIGVEKEILAQDGKRRRLARFDQMLGRALERGRVGQHRKAGCAAGLIGLGELGRLEILADEPLRGARLLDLGDQAEPAFVDCPLQRLDETARGRLALDLALQSRARHPTLYAVLLYFVIYLQDVLGYSALDAGLRLAIISLAQLATSVLAGRFSQRVPARWLIGPGLLLVGIGLIITAGLTGGSTWTHLIPGFIVAGLGSGLVNPPLASTAIGVVPPSQAGMASGVNTTFRQVGIATGIAALGSIFTSVIQSHLAGALPPSLAGSAPRIVNAVRQGSTGQLLASVPAADRAAVGSALRSSFAVALNDLLYVTAGLAIVGAVCATLLIRRKDFYQPESSEPIVTGTAAGHEATEPVAEPPR